MRLVAVLASGALVLSVAGCATTRTTSPRSTVVSSELASSQAVGGAASSGPASSGAASSGPASSGAASSGPASSGPTSAVASAAASSGNFDPELRKLWDLAVSAATGQGSSVKMAQAVRSTHARAVAVTMGDGVEGDEPVWVIQVEGVADFVCNSCSFPQGASAPHGRFQVLILDASTFRTLDFGLSDKIASLAQLGSVVQLHP